MKNIEYADVSWNPITGCRILDCVVKKRGKCWAEKMAYRLKGRYGYSKTDPFRPTFHYDRIKKPLYWHRPKRVDTCFMGDISCAKEKWIEMVLTIILMTPQHRYYILTKDPERLAKYSFPENVWVGVTVNRQIDIYRVEILKQKIDAQIKYVSFEPIYDDITKPVFFEPVGIHWFILGAQTNPEFQPKKEWIENILAIADKYKIPVFMKDNLKYEPKRYEFPNGLRR